MIMLMNVFSRGGRWPVIVSFSSISECGPPRYASCLARYCWRPSDLAVRNVTYARTRVRKLRYVGLWIVLERRNTHQRFWHPRKANFTICLLDAYSPIHDAFSPPEFQVRDIGWTEKIGFIKWVSSSIFSREDWPGKEKLKYDHTKVEHELSNNTNLTSACRV